MDFAKLSAEFPRDAIHWRAQKLTKNGDKALALAYLDARDVMDRLDDVCGPANWQSEYVETPRGRVLCRIGIRVDNEWVWKSDGAGDTAVEGEKGGISDSLKRAAVQWGIGRYLYRLDSVWAPCETFNNKWSKWKGSPWDSVRGARPAQPASANKEEVPFSSAEQRDRLSKGIASKNTEEGLRHLWNHRATVYLMAKLDEPHQKQVKAEYERRLEALAPARQAPEHEYQ